MRSAGLSCLLSGLVPGTLAAQEPWPHPTPEARPWIQVVLPTAPGDPGDIVERLDDFHAAGMGGIEIRPDQPTPDWPSPAWAESARDLSARAAGLGIAVDFALHAGNEPVFEAPDAGNFRITPFSTRIEGGSPLTLDLPAGKIDTLGAWPPVGRPIDLGGGINDAGDLVWDAPPGLWRIHGLILEPAGPALAPASGGMLTRWLEFANSGLATCFELPPRCLTHRRTVAAAADASDGFHESFRRLRGYDLREQLPALLGETDPGSSDRVIHDFRQTLGDLHLAALGDIHQKARDSGSLSRMTIRGNPGHPVDLHAVADIPAISSPEDPPFAASAAHFALKPLVAASLDAATPPGDWRKSLHHLWLRGANQIVLPPLPAPWTAGLPALAGEIAHTQGILQSGAPDPDLLLYFPYHDFLNSRGGLPDDPDERLRWIRSSGFGHAMAAYEHAGIDFDIISDRLLATATADGRRIIVGGLSYAGLVIPEVRCLPETTAVVLEELSKRGASIGIMGAWPTDVPGFPSPDIRRGTLVTCLQNLSQPIEEDDPLLIAEAMGIRGEAYATHGLRGVRRHHADGHHYWICNPTGRPFRGMLELSRPAASVMLLDPALPTRFGLVPVTVDDQGRPSFPLDLAPGASLVIRSFREAREGTAWENEGSPVVIGGPWTLRFPGLESGLEIESPLPGSWRALGHPLLAAYEGSVEYETTLHAADRPPGGSILDLGGLTGACEVFLDHRRIGHGFGSLNRIHLPAGDGSASQRLRIRFEKPAAGHAGLAGPVQWIPLAAP